MMIFNREGAHVRELMIIMNRRREENPGGMCRRPGSKSIRELNVSRLVDCDRQNNDISERGSIGVLTIWREASDDTISENV